MDAQLQTLLGRLEDCPPSEYTDQLIFEAACVACGRALADLSESEEPLALKRETLKEWGATIERTAQYCSPDYEPPRLLRAMHRLVSAKIEGRDLADVEVAVENAPNPGTEPWEFWTCFGNAVSFVITIIVAGLLMGFLRSCR